MTVQSDMALLAAGSYWDIRKFDTKFDNRAPLPDGWTVLTQYDRSDSGPNAGSGFSARVYKNTSTGEIVISYAGTEFDTSSVGLVADFISGNIPLAIGRYAEQAYRAALLYQEVKADPTISDNISFTGHSLGGGLASLMAVYFNRPAYVFAQAPFQLSADGFQSNAVQGLIPDALSALVLPKLRFKLGATADDAIKNYNPLTDFAAREANVQAWAIKGELLEANLGMFNWIEGSSQHLYDNSAITLDASNKHSIDLHVAALLVPDFATQAGKVANALTLLMSSTLYGGDVLGNQQLITTKLIRNEVGIRSDSGVVLQSANGLLTHFSADLQKLGTNIAGLNKSAQDAIIAQGIEWYYWQTNDYAGQEFMTVTNYVLQYTTAKGDALQGAQNKAFSYVNKWLTPLLNASDQFGGNVNYDQWNIASGSDGVTANAKDASKSQIFVGGAGADTFTGGTESDMFLGGAGADILNGGAGSDQLFGGEGADTLDGGAGGDWLYGGAGNDTYQLKSGELFDVIEDSDGNGVITVDGIALTGGKKSGEGYWISTDSDWGYMLSGSGDLTISKGSSLDRITIRNWQSNGGNLLGIVLDNAPAPISPKPGALFFNGDQRAKLIGTETQTNVTPDKPTYGTYAWGETSWAADGTLVNGVVQANFADVINASAAGTNGSIIHGYGGNDALSGSSGKDDIFGDAGDDLIGGGAGSDNIWGGDGNDFIASAETLTTAQRSKPGDSWSPPAGQSVLTQGPGWGIYLQPQAEGDPVIVWSGSNGPAGTDGDVVDAGAGDDWVIASGGDDRVQGGTGDDQIDGMGGNDILEGGDGKDTIQGDGIIKPGFMNSVDAQYNGADFIDGGAGDDTLSGGGGADVIYGGADNDQMWGDASGKTSDADYLDLNFQGNDFLDGEDGADYMEGGGKDDTLYGGTGNDTMWGDTSATNVATVADGNLLWGNDYLNGEEGDDILTGGGKDDTLYGGAGNDKLWGDESDAALAGDANGRDYLDGEDGDDYLVGGGGDAPTNATYLVASHAHYSGAAGRFGREFRLHQSEKQCRRLRLQRSKTSSAHAYSTRPARQQWLAGRMRSTWRGFNAKNGKVSHV